MVTVGGNEWPEMCRRICGQKLFASPQMDADTTLHVAADTDASFWGHQLCDACSVHV